ncbi:MAG TPA: asparagine synthase (glutamine-hydrolyzing), partial [Chitinophagales bacterium]|nr:asparagine synthase (glutamine-hydrolyzing) [Chitinophagales bacterium]
FLARDRYGIKPLHVYNHNGLIAFASELKALFRFPLHFEIDYVSLGLYLQLNYIPGPNSILNHVSKLNPGGYAVIDRNGAYETGTWYTTPYTPGEKIKETDAPNYETAKKDLKQLVEAAVERRLVSDVPLGSFLSGGVDSSIVSLCASNKIKHLNTFSIGYKDEPFFDETNYANLVAKKLGTEHTVFAVSNDDMFNNMFSVLDYIDEPFADSSALAVYMLSQKTREKVTVALSGDGGDELFAGYNKHKAEQKARATNLLNTLLKTGLPVFKMLPKSRHSRMANIFRQLERYSGGLQLSAAGRYWAWCSFQGKQSVLSLFKNKATVNEAELDKRQHAFIDVIKEGGDINDVLYADTRLVLPGDMLTKVDLMSMGNSLEVRVPLLDYTVVDYAFSLPGSYKIAGNNGKRILKDAFRDSLPAEIFDRPKHGFEVPMLKWLRTGLKNLIENELLEQSFIQQQGIFDYAEIKKLKEKLYSANPGDIHAIMWGLVVFQYWYKKYFAAHAKST